MVMYCTCAACVGGPAQPNVVIQGTAEVISGAQVILAPGQTLAHWSGANFNAMSTRDLHRFVQLGHAFRTGVSFYLYNGPAPVAMPRNLAFMGLGGGNCYTIDQPTSAGMQIYAKMAGGGFPMEVAIVVGCGGDIPFNAARQATGYNPTAQLPVLTIP